MNLIFGVKVCGWHRSKLQKFQGNRINNGYFIKAAILLSIPNHLLQQPYSKGDVTYDPQVVCCSNSQSSRMSKTIKR